jgi:hypothetical protein
MVPKARNSTNSLQAIILWEENYDLLGIYILLFPLAGEMNCGCDRNSKSGIYL